MAEVPMPTLDENGDLICPGCGQPARPETEPGPGAIPGRRYCKACDKWLLYQNADPSA